MPGPRKPIRELLTAQAAAAQMDRRRRIWFDALDEATQEELTEARRQWEAGEGSYAGLSPSRMSLVIAKTLAMSGKARIEWQAVRRWLARE